MVHGFGRTLVGALVAAFTLGSLVGCGAGGEDERAGRVAQESTGYVTSALVELRGGDRVFLDRTPEGWKVSAAGCKPGAGEEQPDDCELES